MSNIVILNTTRRLIELPDVNAIVNKKGANRPGYTGPKLLPGENDVDGEFWDLVKKNPAVKMWLAAGYLKNQGEGEARSLLTTLDKMPGENAKRHIEACTSIEMLNTWKSNTDSTGLKVTINARIDAIVNSQSGEASDPVAVPAEA